MAAGAIETTQEVFERRIGICETCPNRGEIDKKDFKIQGCTECFCPFATKLRYDTHKNLLTFSSIKTVCPLGKW